MVAEPGAPPVVGVGARRPGAGRRRARGRAASRRDRARTSSSPRARRSRAARGTRRASRARAARGRARARRGPSARRVPGAAGRALSYANVSTSPSGSSRRGVLRSPHSTRGAASAARYAATASCVRTLASAGAGAIGECRFTISTSATRAAQHPLGPRHAGRPAQPRAARAPRSARPAAPAGPGRRAVQRALARREAGGASAAATAAASAPSPPAGRRRRRRPRDTSACSSRRRTLPATFQVRTRTGEGSPAPSARRTRPAPGRSAARTARRRPRPRTPAATRRARRGRADRRDEHVGLTSSHACSKCDGVGRTWASSPGSASLGHSRCAVLRASSSSSMKQTFVPACTGPLPPSERYSSIASLSGDVVQKPSPMRAASCIAFGPKPETSTGGGSSGQVVDARVLDGVVAAVVAVLAALPQRAHDLDRLLEHLQAHVGLGPVVAEDVLVERLAAADAEVEAPPVQDRAGRGGLRDRPRDGCARSGRSRPSSRAGSVASGERADDRPHERAVALLVVPGVVVVGDPERVEARLPRRAGPARRARGGRTPRRTGSSRSS